ncbi:hypothetical protein ACFY1J_24005 [Streptomyces sp. NPDC001406]|uniref:hypothetical protein n=1 Tax=Streptomyces sp. NPDC001406 TaxID=3364572 RepID=UPI003695C0D6
MPASQPRKRAAAKPADSQPFDFNLDAVQPEQDHPPFRVHWGGRRWTFMHLAELDVWDVLELADAGDVAAMVGAFRAALGEQWGDFRKIRMPQYKLRRLFDAYREHCRIDEDGNPLDGQSEETAEPAAS